jgi:hypothetical protein
METFFENRDTHVKISNPFSVVNPIPFKIRTSHRGRHLALVGNLQGGFLKVLSMKTFLSYRGRMGLSWLLQCCALGEQLFSACVSNQTYLIYCKHAYGTSLGWKMMLSSLKSP